MALPFLVAGILATTAYGAKKGYDAYEDTQEANRYHEKAKSLYSKTEQRLKDVRERSQNLFKVLGEAQFEIINNELHQYSKIIDKL